MGLIRQRAGGILKLLKLIVVQHPWITFIWVLVPVLSGMIIVPMITAERQLIDTAIQYAGKEWNVGLQAAWLPLLMLTGASVGTAVLGWLRKISDAMMADRASLYVLTEIQNRSIHVPLERFENPDFYDSLNRAQAATGSELTGILRNLADTVRLLCTFAGMLVVVSAGHVAISGLLLTVSVVVLVQRLRLEVAVKQYTRTLTTEGRLADYLKQSLAEPTVLKELKVFGAAAYLKQLWYGKASTYEITRNNYRRQEGRMAAWFSLCYMVALFISLGIMLIQLDQGTITVGTVAVIFQTIFQSQALPMQLSWPLSKLYVQGAKASDLVDFLAEPDMDKQDHLKFPDEPVSSIQFENVSFRYPGAADAVLKKVNVTLTAGETVALVGGNGAGKSTFIKLMLGLFNPTEGQVLFNGQDIRDMDKESLWAKLSAVFQECSHYPLSVKEYLLAEQKENNEICAALDSSGLQSLYGNVEGVEMKLTNVWEGGRELSGGQWQRLAIARATLRDSDVIAFDEPTAAIDPSGELELYKSCTKLVQGKLAVFVSHRLGWARFSDRILVLDNGSIVEDGNHANLMEQAGQYADSFRSQASWYEHVGDSRSESHADRPVSTGGEWRRNY